KEKINAYVLDDKSNIKVKLLSQKYGFHYLSRPVKTFKKDILREQLTPIIYSKIEQIRAERAAQDPEYYNRINKELNEGKINILITGGREDDPLTDSIQLFSWDPNTNTLYAVAFPRDLQSPEVLNKTIFTKNLS
ncbi:MAG: hypothetical protein UY61_C0072G0001, partial [Candidatus Adlerbacteria bacterium GW2011_GWC1_50_9]